MRYAIALIGFVSASALSMTTIPAIAADCNVRDVVTQWTTKKTALRDIRLALKKLTAALAGDTPANVRDYAASEFGGPDARQGFVDSVARRQAEYSIVVLQFAGNHLNTPCFVCPIKPAYQLALAASKSCGELITKVASRPGFEGLTFNCDKLRDEGASRVDLGKLQQFGVDYWNKVRAVQGPGLGSLADALLEPQTSDGDVLVRKAISNVEAQLRSFADSHITDPNSQEFKELVATTGCPGYAEYIAGTEQW
jgi:hypothetical protein